MAPRKTVVKKTAKKKTKKTTKNTKELLPVKQFKYERLSASMMKLWLQCKRQFYFRYVLDYPVEENPSFSLGTPVHEALEAATLSLIENPRKLTADEVEEYVQVFRDNISKEFVNDMELFTTGEDAVRLELNSLDPKEKVIAAEQEFLIKTPENVIIYGFMDKVVEVDKSTIRVIDYKTSKQPLSYSEAEKDIQMSMYELAAAILFPQYKIREVELKYLRTGDSVRTTRTSTAQFNFRKQLLAVHDSITDFYSKLNEIKTKDDLPTGQLHSLCPWCSYKESCDSYAKQLTRVSLLGQNPFPTIDENFTDSQFIEEYRNVSLMGKALEEFKDELKLWAVKRIEENSEDPISDGSMVVNSFSTSRRTYPPQEVAKYIPYEELVDLVSISNPKMTSYLSGLEDDRVKSKIEQAAVVKFNNPQFRLKEIK
jgi:RecB family exonuclease